MSATTTFPTAPLQRPKTSLYPITNKKTKSHESFTDCRKWTSRIWSWWHWWCRWWTIRRSAGKKNTVENEIGYSCQGKRGFDPTAAKEGATEGARSYRSRRMLCKWRQKTRHHACMKSLKSHYYQPNCLRHRQRQQYLLHQCTEI